MSQQINLYNPALLPRRDWFTARNAALATAFALALVLVVGSVASSRLAARRMEAKEAAEQLKPLQTRLADLNQKLRTLRPDAALQARLDRLTRQVEGREAVLNLLEGDTGAGKGHGAILAGLARQTTSGLWLTQVDITGASRALELHGRTMERGLVTDYLRRLNTEPAFAGRSFSGLKIDWPAPSTEPTALAASGKPADGKDAGRDQERAPAYLEFVLMAIKAEDAPRPVAQPAPAVDKEKRS